MPALNWLNDWAIDRAETARIVPRWHGLRLVAADASVLMPAIRSCHRTRSLASANQRLFALYLPGCEMPLHASVHSVDTSERPMLMQALDCLGPHDVLLLDRGYPAAWLLSLLCQRGIRFCMRCDKEVSGWASVKQFLRSGAREARVALSTPNAQDVKDWGCAPQAPEVRLVRNVSSNARVRVMATNLDLVDMPWECFGALYHKRWRIEDPPICRSRLQGAPPSDFAGHFGLRLLNRGVLKPQTGNGHLRLCGLSLYCRRQPP